MTPNLLQLTSMTRTVRSSSALLLLFVLSSVLIVPAATVLALDREVPAIVPAPQTADWWMPQHERNVTRVRQGQVDLLMIGDSITQGWGDEGRAVWERYYAHRRAVNLGFNSDRTEQVLWRLQHGEIDGIHPKAAMVMIGTNNSGTRKDPPEETAAGVQAIVTLLRARLPETKILLLGIFPRGATATDSLRLVNGSINARLRGFADGQHLFYLDLGHLFLDRDGRLKRDLMPDLLHPNEQGYRLWAEGMEPQLKALLGE
jgi:beta-glucosidase